MTITPRDFVDRWAQSALREQQGAQSHFNELCELVGHKTPAQMDPLGEFFVFEEQVEKATGGKGRADVWYKGHFAWEYKGKHKDLDDAYHQLESYRGGLDNPPLLVVCDFLEYRIYPQWPNTSGQPFVFHNEDLLDPKTLRYITWLLEGPEKFLELRQSELQRRERITLDLAYKFAHLADLMRKHTDEDGKPAWESLRIARFLTKLVFALFAEDIGLMPTPLDRPVFRVLVDGARTGPEEFVPQLEMLFKAMDGQARTFIMKPVPYFNGGLFAGENGTEALDLTEIPGAIDILGASSQADWHEVNPTIFGTLFEGALDESKRAQLGAHYTSEADIRLVIEPVLMQPLYKLWDDIRAKGEALLQIYLQSDAPRAAQQAKERLVKLHDQMMNTLEEMRVLDPACGSGNFLYVSLRALKDLEAKVRKFFEPLGLPFRDVVTPRQLYGIERDEFAANLARVVVWIGYLQWRYEDEGVLHPLLKATSRPHPRQLPHPILQDKWNPNDPNEEQHIQCADSILRYDDQGESYEPEWPPVEVILGNPPFLGGKRMRTELHDRYVERLFALFENRVPHEADLVCYWYEKARSQVQQAKVKRVGLLATNSIRSGANRIVLERIKQTGDIFMAWSDREWTLEGAEVRISIIGFDNGEEKQRLLDGENVSSINADLTATTDLTIVQPLKENKTVAFQGPVKVGPFDIPQHVAFAFLEAANPSGYDNTDVVRPYMNGDDIVGRNRNYYLINFGLLSEEEAAKYEKPFEFVKKHVKAKRLKNKDRQRRTYWWRLGRSGEDYRKAAEGLSRQIFTPRVAKHRIFIWVGPDVLPDSRVCAICRDEDYFFGVLHSTVHEVWAIRLASWHGVGNDPTYNIASCFETFPLPYAFGQEPKSEAAYLVIAEAAQQLNEEREAWLNPPTLLNLFAEPDMKVLKDRTLTNLYNALEGYRGGKANGGNGLRNGANPAAAFAPRLAELHDTLDQAVLAAYGWSDLAGQLRTAEGNEELLQRLLALNLARA